MKERLLGLIVCPLCKGEFSLGVFESAGEEVESGILNCGCGSSFPIISSIPRLLPPDLQPMTSAAHRDFFLQWENLLKPAGLAADKGLKRNFEEIKETSARMRTARSFGYEWQAFSEMLPSYEENFRWYFERFNSGDFRGKLVLDAGCGMGRHTFHMAQSGAREVIAFDFSEAIETAARNNRGNSNTHFVQADIYNPPFRRGAFDFVYSLGVLHHLPGPERGFRSLLELVRSGGFVNIYLYWNLEGEAAWRQQLLRFVTVARRLTVRIPLNILKRLSWIFAAALEVLFVAPARLLERFQFSNLADQVPLGHYRKYPFRVLYTDQFDRFSAPIENRYSRSNVEKWFEEASLEDVVILGGQGWRASGRKPREHNSSTGTGTK